MADNPIFDYSFVIPAFNEEKNLAPLIDRIKKVMSLANRTYELIIVDNGSFDSTPKVLDQLLQENDMLVVLTMSRNFGFEGAIGAGFEHVRGKKVIVMDGDQQDPPEVLPEFIEKSEEGYEIVYGIRKTRTENWFISILIKTFYRIIKKIVAFDMPKDAGNFGIVDRNVVDIINNMPERNKFMRGLRAWTGFTSAGIVYKRNHRVLGKSKFPFTAYVNHAINGITSFTTAPLRMFTYLGAGGICISLLFGIFIFITKITDIFGYKLLGYIIADGATTITLLVLSVLSINLLAFGILGEYIGRIFEEVKQRPNYLLRNIRYGSHPGKVFSSSEVKNN
jgi:polyisoprenyl-phosphate glycosyltransferase